MWQEVCVAGACCRRCVWQVHVAEDAVCGRYKLEILAGNSGDTEVNLSARQFKTVYQSSQTGAARHEVQELQFNSIKTSEIQVSVSLTII